jgi:hypothetical protein
MALWHCAAPVIVDQGVHPVSDECGVARAVGVIDCPQCGTERAPFRENGEGPVFEFVDTSEPRWSGDREALGVRVHEDVLSGNTEVPERTED